MNRPRPSPTSSPVKKVAKFIAKGFEKFLGSNEAYQDSDSDSESYIQAQQYGAAIILRQIEGEAGKTTIHPATTDPCTNCIFPGGIRDASILFRSQWLANNVLGTSHHIRVWGNPLCPHSPRCIFGEQRIYPEPMDLEMNL